MCWILYLSEEGLKVPGIGTFNSVLRARHPGRRPKSSFCYHTHWSYSHNPAGCWTREQPSLRIFEIENRLNLATLCYTHEGNLVFACDQVRREFFTLEIVGATAVDSARAVQYAEARAAPR